MQPILHLQSVRNVARNMFRENRRDVQIWFLKWAKLMKEHHQYSKKRCLDIAKNWLLELFDGLHKDSMSKWQPVDAPGTSGRKRLVTEEQGMVMAATLFDLIKSGAAVSTELVASQWQEKFSIYASTLWVRSYLHDLGLSFKSATRTTKAPTVEEARTAQTLLRLTLVFCMEEYNIDYQDVYNLDETACQLGRNCLSPPSFTHQGLVLHWTT
eukprot:2464965-Amphidinium_carterae.1